MNTHFQKILPENRAFFPDNVEKYGTTRQAKDDNIIQRMRIVWWIAKATNAHSEYRNNYSRSTAKMVMLKRLIITVYILCISRFFSVYRGILIWNEYRQQQL
jgi:ABC-type xylose transport system permease subunit